ncbi:alpha-tocopherol transfer protein-like [Frankliniella occidentalis]|uniref:Alpha-tocopherol transfer protein-like n=1 Tax=Frankliniella occidentalis TaxID=133901 RepID=A0A6J1RZ01_FRAOC|nr:alpha-tocopherol transfer protein-like [Frankliniella occidentalis]XP_026273569.1 alpha-tocopherol transfer protein-like [Frankliniella occidentalis]XP_052125959.1 alpha-tocopherol transfer protein-like [Frankliniella occidentalis]XP_052125960.1 alpha-tocopherol transfer protein-like [Frankliniella occidentalis]
MEATTFTLEEERKKRPEVKDEDLQAFRDWVDKQPHLPKVSDAELVLFLHTCYYRLEPAKTALDTYFTVRTHAPELFTDRTLQSADVSAAFGKVVLQTIFPTKAKDGSTVSFFKLKDTNPRVYSFTTSSKAWCALQEAWIARHGTEEGLVCVLDVKGVSFGHLAVNLTIMAKFFVYFQEALPVRIKGLVFINASSIMDNILSLIKPFLKKELTEMIKIYKTADGLADLLDKSGIPSDFGGSEKSLEELQSDSIKLLKTYEKYLLEQEKRCVDESQRPGKAKTESDLFGVQGSFKKLDLD